MKRYVALFVFALSLSCAVYWTPQTGWRRHASADPAVIDAAAVPCYETANGVAVFASGGGCPEQSAVEAVTARRLKQWGKSELEIAGTRLVFSDRYPDGRRGVLMSRNTDRTAIVTYSDWQSTWPHEMLHVTMLDDGEGADPNHHSTLWKFWGLVCEECQ